MFPRVLLAAEGSVTDYTELVSRLRDTHQLDKVDLAVEAAVAIESLVAERQAAMLER